VVLLMFAPPDKVFSSSALPLSSTPHTSLHQQSLMDRQSHNAGSSHTNIASAQAAEREARQELADWRRALEASLTEQTLQGDYMYLVNRLVSPEV
jgi:hypothetical protein